MAQVIKTVIAICLRISIDATAKKEVRQMKRFIALILSAIMMFSLSSQAFAASIEPEDVTTVVLTDELGIQTGEGMSEAEVRDVANKTFDYLTPEQQEVYIYLIESLAISGDYSLVEFHQRYVDPNYRFEPSASSRSAIVNDEVVLYNAASIAGQLQALNLPEVVYNGFMALAAALAMPVGNVVDIVIGLGLGVIIVANWDAISSKWNDIVDIFVNAFGSTVMEAFYYLQGLVGIYTVTVSGKTITVNNDKYNCTTKADVAVADMKNNGHQYYPAVLSGSYVWVAPVDISRKVALAIMKINSSSAGIFTVTSNLARNLCESLGGAKGPEIHGSGSKYWWHYHGRSYMNAHCWYVA